MTREEVLAHVKEIHEVWPQGYYGHDGPMFDLKVASAEVRHCSTCNCTNYVSFSGWSFKTTEHEGENFRKLSTADKIAFLRLHPEAISNARNTHD